MPTFAGMKAKSENQGVLQISIDSKLHFSNLQIKEININKYF